MNSDQNSVKHCGLKYTLLFILCMETLYAEPFIQEIFPPAVLQHSIQHFSMISVKRHIEMHDRQQTNLRWQDLFVKVNHVGTYILLLCAVQFFVYNIRKLDQTQDQLIKINILLIFVSWGSRVELFMSDLGQCIRWQQLGRRRMFLLFYSFQASMMDMGLKELAWHMFVELQNLVPSVMQTHELVSRNLCRFVGTFLFALKLWFESLKLFSRKKGWSIGGSIFRQEEGGTVQSVEM